MGNQVGIVTFTGKVGDLVGFKKKNGKIGVKKKPKKVPIEIRQNAPQYEETRKNEAEFGVASRCGQLFRQAMLHITNGWTDMDYTPGVMKVMVQTLRADNEHVKGQKSINYGLKCAESQMMFKRLVIFQKKSYAHFRNSLFMETSDTQSWKLNREALWRKRNDGELKTVKIGFLHIDFDQKIAKYEDGFTIICKRNEKIDFSEHSFLPSNEIKAPWTFVIMQVWRDGPISEPTGMLFMNVLQVMQNNEINEFGLHGVGELGEQDAMQHNSKIWDEKGVHWDAFLDIHFGEGFDQWELGNEDVLEQENIEEKNSDMVIDENLAEKPILNSNDYGIENSKEAAHSDVVHDKDDGKVLDVSCLEMAMEERKQLQKKSLQVKCKFVSNKFKEKGIETQGVYNPIKLISMFDGKLVNAKEEFIPDELNKNVDLQI